MQLVMKSAKKIAVYVVGFVLLYLLAGFLYNQFTYGNPAALVWHWRHGDTARLTSYEIPVPERWFVSRTSPGSIELVRVQNQGLHHQYFASKVTVSSTSEPFVHLDEWKGMVEALQKNNGERMPRSREIQLGLHNRLVCLEGEHVRGNMSVKCRSDARLELMFIGKEANVQEFYIIVGKIRYVS